MDNDFAFDANKITLLEELFENTKWCWSCPKIPRATQLQHHNAFHFFRDFVFKNTPCVLEMNPPSSSRSWQSLTAKLANKSVRVNVTPNGRADSVVFDPTLNEKVFAMPEEREMKFSEFSQWLLHSPPTTTSSTMSRTEIFYLSAQNDSLRDEFPELFADKSFTPNEIQAFGNEVFGKEPDAVNLWIGDARSVSVVHRDNTYENLYCCLLGTKVFHLLPPCVAALLNERPFPNAQWRNGKLERVSGHTPWIEHEITGTDVSLPEKIQSMMLVVELKAGECLYLPAGWLHRVTQTEPTLAVNFWYDRDFNAIWALNDAVEQLVNGKRKPLI